MNYRQLLAQIIFLVFGTIAFTACTGSDQSSSSSNSSGGSTQSSTNPAVQAVQARFGSLPLEERLSGSVVALNQIEIYPEVNARVEEVLVQTGQYVQKDEVLIRLRSEVYEQQLRQAQAQLRINKAQVRQAETELKRLQSQYDRIRQLSEKELSSNQELETIQAELESAEADLELAEAQRDQTASLVEERQEQLSRTVIRAPFSGRIGERNVEQGMNVNTNTALFRFGKIDRVKVYVDLTEEMLSYVREGQTARVFSDQLGDTVITAEVSRISPFLNSVTTSARAEIDIPNPDGLLKPGMFVTVDILYGESQQAILIPNAAIYDDPNTGEDGIFVATSLNQEVQPVEDIDPDNPPPYTSPTPVEFIPIEIIARGRQASGISGIESGQWVITLGQNLLVGSESQARVRTVSWERLLRLQESQSEELLRRVMNREYQTPPSVSTQQDADTSSS
ncbi:MAG: efflux RND transporter periplasmic adaptor subunit [Bacteroidota bacterium]